MVRRIGGDDHPLDNNVTKESSVRMTEKDRLSLVLTRSYEEKLDVLKKFGLTDGDLIVFFFDNEEKAGKLLYDSGSFYVIEDGTNKGISVSEILEPGKGGYIHKKEEKRESLEHPPTPLPSSELEVESEQKQQEKKGEIEPQKGQIWRQEFQGDKYFKIYKVIHRKTEDKEFDVYVLPFDADRGKFKGSLSKVRVGDKNFLSEYEFLATNESEFFSNFKMLSTKELEAAGAERFEPLKKDAEGNDAPLPDPEDTLELGADQELSEPEREKNVGELGTKNTPDSFEASEPDAGRETLVAALAEARRIYIEDDHHCSTKSNWFAKVLGVSTEIAPEPEYKEDYEKALKALQKHDLDLLQFEIASLSEAEQNERIKSHLLRYSFEEKIALYTLGNEVKLEHEKGDWWGKARESSAQFVNGYRQLDWKAKLGIAAAVLGVSFATASVGGVAAGIGGAAWAARRAVASAAGYMAAEEGINKLADVGGKKLAERDIKKFIEKGELTTEKLLEEAERRIEALDSQLQARKSIARKAKIGAFIAAIGLPTALSHTDWFTAGEEKAEAGYPASTETAVATDPENPASTELEGGTLLPEDTSGEKPGAADVPEAGDPPEGAPEKSISAGEAQAIERALEEAAANGDAPNPEAGAGTFELQSVTVEKGDNLWNLVESQLPANITDETEKNRIIASTLNYIHNDIQNLTDAEVQEKYGLTSRDLNLIHPGEVIKFDAIPKDQLQAIIEGQSVLPTEVAEIPAATPEVSEAAASSPDIDQADTKSISNESSSKLGLDKIATAQPELYDDYEGDTPTQVENVGYQPESASVSTENFVGKYSYEMSTVQSLPEAHKELFNESMNILQEELRTIDHPEFGENYRLSNLKTAEFWGQYKGDSMQDIVYFDQPRYEHDPRDMYRDRLERQIGRRGIYLAPEHPRPTLSSPPDPYAIHSMNRAALEYRHNLADMQRATFKTFGEAGLPISAKETVKEYLARVGVLVTRARLENPDFRLKF